MIFESEVGAVSTKGAQGDGRTTNIESAFDKLKASIYRQST